MSDLSEFLLARITEDEARARTEYDIASRAFPASEFEIEYTWARHTRMPSTGGRGTSFAPGAPSPARVLAECEAKRRIVELHQPAGSYLRSDGEHSREHYCATCGSGESYLYPAIWPCETLQLLAVCYRSHPDYRSEWAP